MKHTLVKVITTREGNYSSTEDYWCLNAYGRQLCTGEYIEADGRWQQVEEKERAKGGITCPECLEMIKEIKKVRL